MAAKDKTGINPIHANSDHPVDAGVGAVGGAVAGAAIGAVGGPAGAAVGAVIGAIAGGLAGMGVGEMHDHEDSYWRSAHTSEPYFRPGFTYDDYQPAYRMGYSSRARDDGGNFDQHEPAFRNDWDTMKGGSRLAWEDAKHAVRAGWHRFEPGLRGDADGDSR
jgi:hypothetical protein